VEPFLALTNWQIHHSNDSILADRSYTSIRMYEAWWATNPA
jgi:hypothetical protein